MKKILVIDPISSNGHITYNNILINYLLNNNFDITFAGTNDYINNFKDFQIKFLIIHNINIKINFMKNFINRLQLIYKMIFIKWFIKKNNYDIILFSSFENISFLIANIKIKNSYLICHNNVSNIKNIFNVFILKFISKFNVLLVFQDSIKDNLYNYNILNVIKINHGLPHKKNLNIIPNIILKDFNINLNKFIFIPNSNIHENNILIEIFNNKDFENFIFKNNIYIIVKSSYLNINFRNIIFLESYIDKNLYDNLFLRSILILLPYNKNFKNRISCTLLECLVNSKYCLLSENIHLMDHKKYFYYNPYFTNSNNLIKKIYTIIESNNICEYKNLNELDLYELPF
jgi:hypothetical protein